MALWIFNGKHRISLLYLKNNLYVPVPHSDSRISDGVPSWSSSSKQAPQSVYLVRSQRGKELGTTGRGWEFWGTILTGTGTLSFCQVCVSPGNKQQYDCQRLSIINHNHLQQWAKSLAIFIPRCPEFRNIAKLISSLKMLLLDFPAHPTMSKLQIMWIESLTLKGSFKHDNDANCARSSEHDSMDGWVWGWESTHCVFCPVCLAVTPAKDPIYSLIDFRI